MAPVVTSGSMGPLAACALKQEFRISQEDQSHTHMRAHTLNTVNPLGQKMSHTDSQQYLITVHPVTERVVHQRHQGKKKKNETEPTLT